MIGRGKFGVVYKGYHKQTKKAVAIKVLELDTQYDEVVDVQQEIQFLADLKSVPNVTHYYGSFLVDTKLWIIMDYCAGGSIRTLLKAGVFEEKYVGVVAREVLTALLAVHKMGVIHRDIKAANILITHEGNVQLCDFGVAVQLTTTALKRATIAGTPFWMAPEVIREGDQYNVKADIWSLGITLYEIATGNPPYCEKGATWAMTMIEKLTPPRLEGREYPPALKECVAMCLDENPEERPSADEVLKCKLVRLYKNHATSTLKEVISRYLLWRDRNSSRDSVFINIEDEPAENANNPIQMKWDFDSLSSREYIIENDIHLNDDELLAAPGMDDHDLTFTTQPTYRYQTNGANDTITHTNGLSSVSTGSRINTGEKSNYATRTNTTANTTTVPKSLMSLFEEEDSAFDSEEFDDFKVPKMPVLSSLVSDTSNNNSSPTIEIPDMESLAKISTQPSTSQLSSQPSSSQLSAQVSSSQLSTSHLPPSHLSSSHIPLRLLLQPQNEHDVHKLNKPPQLVHSQSSSAALDSRHNSPIPNRSRQRTVSNPYGSMNQTLDPAVPHTPSYSGEFFQKRETPSPLAQALAEFSVTASPSKSMRALQSNNNPMLQPINFKSGESATKPPATSSQSSGAAHTTPGIGLVTSHPPTHTPHTTHFSHTTHSTHSTHPTQSSTHSSQSTTHLTQPATQATTQSATQSGQSATHPTTATGAALSHSKKEKPLLRIQMPVPFNGFHLQALTNELEGKKVDDNVNQFGINPALVNNMTSMTPVTEKENAFEEPRDLRGEVLRQPLLKKLASMMGPKTAPVSHPAQPNATPVFFPPRHIPTQLSQASVPTTANNATAATAAVKNDRFPKIPELNSDMFLDTQAKDKITEELENMIRLFSQGLEALESAL